MRVDHHLLARTQLAVSQKPLQPIQEKLEIWILVWYFLLSSRPLHFFFVMIPFFLTILDFGDDLLIFLLPMSQ